MRRVASDTITGMPLREGGGHRETGRRNTGGR